MEEGIEDGNKRSLRVRTKPSSSKETLDERPPNAASEPVASKRSSRSRDPEFAAKQKAFMQKVVTATMDANVETNVATAVITTAEVNEANGLKRKFTISRATSEVVEDSPANKRRKSSRNSTSGTESQNDCYCWICHKEGDVICCETCPRVFHLKCIQLENAPTEDWVCPECVLIMTAENMDTRSRAMRLLTVDQLCVLLRHALARMRTVSGVEPFTKPVDINQFPAYRDYVFCPMDLTSVEKNIKKKQYGSTEAFLADVKWVLHNCIIFNSLQSKLTSIAKSLVKICKHEMQEIENCPDCYLNAHSRKDSWFVAACRIPHLLVWAKLKGFPFWPAKAMRINAEENVDVRFFGAHDRAWIPIKDVYLYSEEAPQKAANKKRGNLEGCMHEVDLYIKNITEKFGKFTHAPSKTNLDPKKEEDQIKILYPTCTLPFELGARRRTRTFSFSGSERSHTATPTPSEVSESQIEIDPMSQDSSQTELEEDNLEQLPVPALPEKPDLIEDEMLPKEIEDELLEESQTETETNEAPVIEEPMTDKPSEDDDAEQKIADTVTETNVEEDNNDVVNKNVKTTTAADDRAAASPPCEVSSTTLNPTESKDSSETPSTATPKESSKKPETQTEVIAETSETVEIEGQVPAADEEEIDDVEEEIDDVEEVDDVEPEVEKVKEPVEKPKEPIKEPIEQMDVDQEEKPAADKPVEKPCVQAPDPESDKDNKKLAASSEEEIDDEEPELVIEENPAEAAAENNVGRLAASGISVTVIEKKKLLEENSKQKSSEKTIGLSSDISVTVVHKKKIDVGSSGHQKSSQPQPPKISVKKESELLQDPKKDIVEVTTRTKPAQVQQQPRKPSVEVAHLDKAPSPIVTISKVASAASPGASLLRTSTPKSASPALTTKTSTSASTGPSPASTSTATAALNSLASILGQPRMTALPGGVHPHPRFAPGGPGGRSLAGPPQNRNSSPLMIAAGATRAPFVGMPNLHPRPLFGSPSGTPPVTGPVSEQLNKVAGKLVDYMRGTLEELFMELSSQGSPEATVKALQIEMEKMQWRHQQELAEVKRNADLLMMELRQTMEAEKQKTLSDFKKQADIEKHKAVAETKKKQWCAHCGKEAIFYCCWNTSYCDYPCQQAHWPSHMSTCAQNQSNQDEDGPGADANEGNSHHETAAQHFLSTSQSSNGPASRTNGLPAQPTRGMQANPMMMPFGPQGGLSPRMMNQLNMRMAAAQAAMGGGPRVSLPGGIRFPGSYFM